MAKKTNNVAIENDWLKAHPDSVKRETLDVKE